MIYKFYDASGLINDKNNLFTNPEERIVVCSYTLNELSYTETGYELYKYLIKNVNKFILYDVIPSIDNEIQKVPLEIREHPALLAAAIFDLTIHPDETVYVTGEKWLVPIANLFFGEDSIIYVEPTI